MPKIFKDPRTACWAIPGAVLGLIAVGGFFSVPQFAQAKNKAEHTEKALTRLADCYLLESGKLKPGYSYAIASNEPGGESILADGELVCDRNGMTALITSKSAAYLRRADQKAFNAELEKLYPIDPESGKRQIRLAFESKHYKPDPSKRPAVKEPKDIGWLESYEQMVKSAFGVK